MKVRIILFTFALVVWGTIHLAEAQSWKVHRIGLLIAASNVIEPFTDAFRRKGMSSNWSHLRIR